MSFYSKILRRIAKTLYPYLHKEEERLSRQCILTRAQKFAACGKDLYFDSTVQVKGYEYIQIGDQVSAGSNLRLEAIKREGFANPCLRIGSNVSCIDFCHIGCVECVEIGDGTLMASKVFITDHFHGDVSANDLHTPPQSVFSVVNR